MQQRRKNLTVIKQICNHRLMKPDNKKRKKVKRRPDNYYKNWEQKRKLRAKHFKAGLKVVKE